jgi:hypothetical protein
MQIDKSEILNLLQSQNKHDQAQRADAELNRPGFHADFLLAASPDGEPVRSA